MIPHRRAANPMGACFHIYSARRSRSAKTCLSPGGNAASLPKFTARLSSNQSIFLRVMPMTVRGRFWTPVDKQLKIFVVRLSSKRPVRRIFDALGLLSGRRDFIWRDSLKEEAKNVAVKRRQCFNFKRGFQPILMENVQRAPKVEICRRKVYEASFV